MHDGTSAQMLTHHLDVVGGGASGKLDCSFLYVEALLLPLLTAEVVNAS